MKIDINILYNLLCFSTKGQIIDHFELIEDNIISSDYEDGGAYHVYVLKDHIENKYYKGTYYDWDIEHNTELDDDENIIESDLDNTLKEVFPKEKTIIVYE